MMFFLAILYFVLSAHVMAADNSSVDGLTYEDLPKTCYPLDTCVLDGREPDYVGNHLPPTCSCDVDCARFGICCINSPHRGRSPTTHKCFAIEYPESYTVTLNYGYYMHQSCPENSVWKPLCERGLDEDGDVLSIAPVSSLETNTTYKNYYCFRCNEQTDNFLYWNLILINDFNHLQNVTGDFKVTYDSLSNTWFAAAVDKDFYIPVTLRFLYPEELRLFLKRCEPEMVTECPDSWKDDDVRSKCHSYMGILYDDLGPIYKNGHCALCNSYPMGRLPCNHPGSAIRVRSFTFAHLIDVNLRDKKENKCADGKVWDGYGKKCRKLSCALPGYVIKDGECVAP